MIYRLAAFRAVLPLACLACQLAMAAAPLEPGTTSTCLNDNALAVRVRIADLGTGALDAVLVGGPAHGLQLRDARSGAVWWTAGARATDLQRFSGMGRFASRPAAVDLDGDGIHDRFYALDTSGTLWRLDLSAQRPRDRWAEGGVLAQLLTDTAQHFATGIDAALHMRGSSPWISLAFGNITTGPGPVANRFYVLRDRHPFTAWTDVPERAGWPLGDADLRLADGTLLEPESPASGFYLHLGAGQPIAPSLTVAGRVVFTTALLALHLDGNCLLSSSPGEHAPIQVRSVRADRGGAGLDLDGNGELDSRDLQPRELGELAVRSGVGIQVRDGPPGPRACVVSGMALPGCGIDTRVERTWWLREDAD